MKVDAREGLGDGGGVGVHAHGALLAGEVAARHDGRRLVVDAALEADQAPVHELDGAPGLDVGDGGFRVLRDGVAAVHETALHVLAVAQVALGHHGGGLKARVGDLDDGELLVIRLLGRDDQRVGREHEVDARVRRKVGLGLSEVDVERAVEAERGRERRGDLRHEAVQIGVGRALNVEVAASDVVQRLVVEAEGDVRVLERRVRGEHAVEQLDDGGGGLRRRVDGEARLGLAALVDERHSDRSGPKPKPVSPPVAGNMREPWRPVQLSASLRSRSSTRSTISLPVE